jgi:hypothetical protein
MYNPWLVAQNPLHAEGKRLMPIRALAAEHVTADASRTAAGCSRHTGILPAAGNSCRNLLTLCQHPAEHGRPLDEQGSKPTDCRPPITPT